MTVLGIHPVSPIMVAFYFGGLKLIQGREGPMWTAVVTPETRLDRPEEDDPFGTWSSKSLAGEFAAIAVVAVLGGWAVARAAESVVTMTGLSEGFVGGVLIGGVNALPETVTAITAVRRGALTLAVAAVIGGTVSMR